MHKINRLVATVCGIGYLPLAPGTFAAAFAVIVWYFVAVNYSHTGLWQLPLLVFTAFLGIYCSGKVSLESGKDPSFVVIDEVAGMWVSLLIIPPSITNYLLAFVLFRFFDIAKPLGIRKMEKLKNGWGIMLDDILAGIYSNIALRFLIALKLW